MEVEWVLAQERNMRTSANKMELLHLVGLYVQNKIWEGRIRGNISQRMIELFTLGTRSIQLSEASEDPKLDATCHYKFLSHRFISLAPHATKYEEIFELVNNALCQLQLQVDERIFRDAPFINSTNNNQTSQEEVNNEAMLQRVTLKKKEVKPRCSKRKRSWVEKLFRRRK
jgi:hypothetical protein